MLNERKDRVDFGCAHCWPASADDAWEARRALDREEDLIGESHFHVMILACGRCGQRFVSVFTEMIDWVDGDDPQYWTLLPLTDEEATLLARRGGAVAEAQLNALGPERRCLRRDYPKASSPRCSWGTGVWVGPHD